MTITLEAAQTVRGVAGTATAVTYTLLGDEAAGGADAFKVLAQGQLPAAAGLLYTVPALTASIVKSIHLANATALAVTGVKLYIGGTAAANQITGSITIPANGSAIYGGDGWRIYDANGNLLTTSTIALTGDVTGSGTGSIATSIALGAVTYAKIQDQAQATFLMRAAAAGTGPPIAGTAAQAKTALAIVPGDVTGFDTQVRTSRLDQMATPTADVSLGGFKVTSLANGTVSTDAVNLGQLTAAVEGRANKDPALWGTTAAIALTGLGTQAGGEWTGALTAGQRILVKNQAASADDGVYLAAAGAWTRALDMNTGAEATNASVLVLFGATLTGDTYTQTATVATIGTDPQTWVQTGEGATLAADGITLQLVGTTLSVKPLGIGTASLENVLVAGGPIGTAGTTPTITWDAKGRLTAVTSTAITPAGIGAPSGSGTHSGTSSGTNTGDQTISLTGDVTAVGGTGALATTVVKLQGIAVSATAPAIGMDLRYGPTSWQPTRHEWNVVNFGADPTAAADSALAIYNAHTACGITAGAQYLLTTANATTSTANFTVSVTANAAFPSSGTGTLIAMTTRGLVYMTWTGGSTNTLTCAVTAGVAGGTLLAGSLMGVASTTQVGGCIYYPPGLYLLTAGPIVNSIPGVHERGVAASGNADAGNWGFSGGSWLYYNGSLGDFVMTHVPITGTLGLQAGQALHGIRVTGMNFACSGSTGYGLAGGLRLISCNGWYLEDLFVNEPASIAYEFTTLGAAMLSEAHDTTRGTAINLRWRALAGPGGATAAQISAAGTAITAGAGTNINTFAGASTISTAALTAAAWPTPGLAMVQAIDQTTGNVMDYLVTYTGNAGPGLTGVATVPLWFNQANSTTLAAAAPATGNPKPSALLFAGALVRPAYAAYALGVRLHGSASANTSVNTFITTQGNHWMGAGWYLGNSDSNKFFSTTMNRTAAGTPTGIGWDVQGATAIVGASGASRNNRWYGGDPGPGGANFRGTNSYGYTAPAAVNNWYDHELGNGAPGVTLGTGVQSQITYNGCLIPGGVGTANAALQSLAASTRTLITGSSIQVPTLGLVAGWTRYRVNVQVNKTAAGVATWQLHVAYGTANTTADGAIANWTSGTNTAAIDAGIIIVTIDILTLGATATAACTAKYVNRLTDVTGLGLITFAPTTTATFNSGLNNPGPSFFHVDITPGAAAVMTCAADAECLR